VPGPWSTLHGKSVQGMDLLLTFSNVQQSTLILNKRGCLKTVTVDDLSGVIEAGNVRGSSPIRCILCVILRVCYTV